MVEDLPGWKLVSVLLPIWKRKNYRCGSLAKGSSPRVLLSLLDPGRDYDNFQSIKGAKVS